MQYGDPCLVLHPLPAGLGPKKWVDAEEGCLLRQQVGCMRQGRAEHEARIVGCMRHGRATLLDMAGPHCETWHCETWDRRQET
jgi:hypothetical protein